MIELLIYVKITILMLVAIAGSVLWFVGYVKLIGDLTNGRLSPAKALLYVNLINVIFVIMIWILSSEYDHVMTLYNNQ